MGFDLKHLSSQVAVRLGIRSAKPPRKPRGRGRIGHAKAAFAAALRVEAERGKQYRCRIEIRGMKGATA